MDSKVSSGAERLDKYPRILIDYIGGGVIVHSS